MTLFAVLKSAHRLPKKHQKLLRQAAVLATVGAATNPEHPYPAGHDLILAQPLRGVATADRLALACIVAFQREKAKPEREPTFAALEEKLQGQVVTLAALLRIAEALDFSRSQGTAVLAVEAADADQVEISRGRAGRRGGCAASRRGRRVLAAAHAPGADFRGGRTCRAARRRIVG